MCALGAADGAVTSSIPDAFTDALVRTRLVQALKQEADAMAAGIERLQSRVEEELQSACPPLSRTAFWRALHPSRLQRVPRRLARTTPLSTLFCVRCVCVPGPRPPPQ